MTTESVQKKIQEITDRIVREFEPEKIILFGSHAWGQPDKNSDVDIMVIVRDGDLSPTKRSVLAHRCLRGLNIPKDIIVKTHAEIEKYRNVHESLECEVLEHGKVLWVKTAQIN